MATTHDRPIQTADVAVFHDHNGSLADVPAAAALVTPADGGAGQSLCPGWLTRARL